MSSAIFRICIEPENEERFLEIVGEIVEAMKSTEPETRVYGLWKTQKPQEYLLFESYLSKAAFKFHEVQHLALLKEFQTLVTDLPEVEKLGDFAVGVPDVGTLPCD